MRHGRPRRRRQARATAGEEEGGVRANRRAATLPVSFFDRPADVVARELLGALVVSRIGGRPPPAPASSRPRPTSATGDPASHGYLHRRNERNAALFGPPGLVVRLPLLRHSLVRQSGVRRRRATASAVLLRALEPVEGIQAMRSRRGRPEDRELCSGPGKLCQALGITRGLDGRDDGRLRRRGGARRGGATVRRWSPRRASASPKRRTGRSGFWSAAIATYPAAWGER